MPVSVVSVGVNVDCSSKEEDNEVLVVKALSGVLKAAEGDTSNHLSVMCVLEVSGMVVAVRDVMDLDGGDTGVGRSLVDWSVCFVL